jgi:hypothetical protein
MAYFKTPVVSVEEKLGIDIFSTLNFLKDQLSLSSILDASPPDTHCERNVDHTDPASRSG